MKLITLLLSLIFTINAHGMVEADRQLLVNRNILVNGGFENGAANWTAASGGFSTTSTTPLVPNMMGVWDATASTQTLVSPAITVPAGLKGLSGVGFCEIQTPSGTATHTLQVYDGTNVIASQAVISSTDGVYIYTNVFRFPSSGTVQLRLLANANEPSINIDDCYLGLATNMTNSSQATFIGSGYIAQTANCSWTRTNTALGAFGTDTDCPGVTVESNPGPGVLQTTDSDLPQFTFNNLPSGTYRVVIFGAHLQSSTNSEAVVAAISDGTTTSPGAASFTATGQTNPLVVETVFTYTSSGNRTFAVHGSAASTRTVTLGMYTASSGTGAGLAIRLYRYPTVNELAFKPDAGAQSWSGYHDSTCSWARTNTAYGDPTADATCVFTERSNVNFGTVTSQLSGSDKLPGIVFTPKSTGRYFVCVYLNDLIANSGAGVAVQLTDGTTAFAENQTTSVSSGTYVNFTLCGIYNATTIASTTLKVQSKASSGANTIQSGISAGNAADWSIFYMDQSFPAPVISNSVVNTSSGVTGVEVANINCDSGSAITSQQGSWLTSVGNISGGQCVITLNGSYSATPYCSITNRAAIAGDSSTFTMSLIHTSSTSLTSDCRISAGATADCTAYDFTLSCVGAK